MAEPISLASGLLALSVFAFKSGVTLHNTIQSFRNHPSNVRDLNDELAALNGVLDSLTETVRVTTDVDFSALSLPLLRCGNACNEFQQKLLKCSSRSGGDGMSLRGWAQLKYMGDGIDNFRHMLAAYKSTIAIALNDANLRRSSITAESVDNYRDMIKTNTVDLEARLEIIDEKLESILDQSATEPGSDGAELRQMKDKRLSTQKCLEICAQLFDHINKVPLRSVPSSGSPTRPVDSEEITNEGLRKCRETLNSTTSKLERHMEGLIDRLKTTMPSEEGVAELATLQEEWESARRCIDICSSADKNISVIDNFSTGDDSIQFLVSTKQKTIHGKNRGFGLRTKQVGGHLSDESLQQILRDISRMGFQNSGDQTLLSPANASPAPNHVENESSEEFRKRYGRGLKLASESAPGTITSSRGSAEG